MKKKIAILCLFAASACVREIDINLPEEAQKLVLNCILEKGQPIRATASISAPFEQLGPIPYLADAELSLSENGENPVLMSLCDTTVLRDSTLQFQYCSGKPLLEGQYYKITLRYPGFEAVSGTTSMPYPAEDVTVEASLNDYNPLFREGYGLQVELSFKDPRGVSNYYALEVFEEELFGSMTRAEIITNEPLLQLYGNRDLISIPTDAKTGPTAYFTDEYFDGNTITLKFQVNTNSNIRPDTPFLFRLRSLSKPLFDYLQTNAINSRVGYNPFAEPVRVLSNIEGGFGIVGAQATTEVWIP